MIFDRQIPCWGTDNQEKLRSASLFIAGIGGLGCLMSEILVRSGVGRIYLCDNGSVEETDLNRQIFYTKSHIDQKKITIAEDRLSGIHSFSEIITIDTDIRDKGFSIPEDATGVVDCLDNFESRFSLWDNVKPGHFFVHAGVEDFFGQVVTLIKGKSPDLRNIFGNISREKRTIPVNAASVSVVSSIAASEVLKNVFDGPKLLNLFLIIDLSDYTFSKVNL